MDGQVNRLMQRIRDLEKIESDYYKMKQLLDYATENGELDRFRGEIILESDPDTGLVLNANDLAIDMLGYTIDQIRALKITDLEVHPPQLGTGTLRYVETSIEKQIYDCFYRQSDGHLLRVRVQKRFLIQEGRKIYHYALDDLSLRRKLWRELSRREDHDFHFRERLKDLNTINTELSIIDDFDQICYTAIRLGMDKLGFDRLSLWFVEPNTYRMVGAYGTDEQGNIRDERGASWSFQDTPIQEFANGSDIPVITQDSAPIYNEKSEIIGYGWHISVPLRYKGEFIGYMTADNYLKRQPMKDYQPELLRAYGATIGHFAQHQRAREMAKKLAEDINLKQARVKLLETFINQVGHDFRTPLTVISTNAYLLNKSKDEERRANLAQSIQGQVMYINRVIRQTLDVVKLESGLQLDPEPVEIDGFVNDIARALEPNAQEKGLEWAVQRTHPFVITADPDWLRLALREVVTNAIQYTETGGRVSIGIAMGIHEATIRVQDTGIGIPVHEQAKIFTHLYRVDQARSSRGVGLGLTMAKLVIESHGGQIRVESTPGHGSTFEIMLPR